MLKLFLWLRYLRKRKIVFLSIAAVALSVSLLIVVASLFTGFIKAFEQAAVDAIGDVVISPLRPFKIAKYPLLIDQLEQTQTVEAATGILMAPGLLNLGQGNVRPVEIWGIEPGQRARVTDFKGYLRRQKDSSGDPSFTVPGSPEQTGGFVGIGVVAEPNEQTDEYDSATVEAALGQRVFVTTGAVNEGRQDNNATPQFRKKTIIFRISDIVETGVFQFDEGLVYLPIEKLQKGLYPDEASPVAEQIFIKLAENKEDNGKSPFVGLRFVVCFLGIFVNLVGLFWFIVVAFEKSVLWGLVCIFVPFVWLVFLVLHWKNALIPFGLCVLGTIFFFAAGGGIMFHSKDDTQNDTSIAVIQGVWENFVREHLEADPYLLKFTSIETARQMQSRYVAAYKNQMAVLLVIFGVVSFSVVVLVFCIFYMIVTTKRKDIAIIKSCGMTSRSVAAVFVGFGAVIGVVGSMIGAVLGHVITRNINVIEHWISIIFGLKLWKSSVYMFSKIPNQVDWPWAFRIILVAILAAAIGTLIPAVIAALTRPVEILRYE